MFTSPDPPPRPVVDTTPKRTDALYVVVARSPAELIAHRDAWAQLGRDAAEPNSFLEPYFLLPALSAAPADPNLRFVLIYAGLTAQRRKPLLVGFFPVVSGRMHRLLPFRTLRSHAHAYGFLSTPLVHRDDPCEALEAFFAWMREDKAALWRVDLLSADGPFAHALTRTCDRLHRPTFVADAYVRAMIRPGLESADAYKAGLMARKRMKEFVRRERELGERGKLEKRAVGPGEDVGPWAEAFLALEASGWKGKAGTAMAAKPADAAFFREMVRQGHAEGRVDLLGLYLDGKPLALKVNPIASPGGFAFKIAFDEAYATSSPGVLLELFCIDRLYETRSPLWLDSCALPNHFMIERLWAGRRLVQSLVVATGRAPGDLAVSLFPVARWLKRLVRRPKPRPAAGEEI